MALKSVKTALAFCTEVSLENERGWPDTARLRYASPSSDGERGEGNVQCCVSTDQIRTCDNG